MASTKKPYLVYAYPFDDTSGGKIALYLLCERLLQLGEVAVLWGNDKPGSWKVTGFHTAKTLARHLFLRRDFPLTIGSTTLTEGKMKDVSKSIVVYPEIIDGNPLGASKVVRWFLHRPGNFSGRVNYGNEEIYFFYQDAFNDPSLNDNPNNRLTLTWLNPAYKQTALGERTGICYLLRKGASRAKGLDLSQELCVDDLSHLERASAFNKYKYLVSYDPYSMYSVFAAMCGCIPIILPEDGVSKEQWFPDPNDRLGLAYGWEDEDNAVNTRGLLLEKLASDRCVEDEMLRRFIFKTQSFFS